MADVIRSRYVFHRSSNTIAMCAMAHPELFEMEANQQVILKFSL